MREYLRQLQDQSRKEDQMIEDTFYTGCLVLIIFAFFLLVTGWALGVV